MAVTHVKVVCGLSDSSSLEVLLPAYYDCSRRLVFVISMLIYICVLKITVNMGGGVVSQPLPCSKFCFILLSKAAPIFLECTFFVAADTIATRGSNFVGAMCRT